MHQKYTHTHLLFVFFLDCLGFLNKGALSIYPPSLDRASFGGVLESTPDTRLHRWEIHRSTRVRVSTRKNSWKRVVSVVFFGWFLSQMK